MTRNKKEDVTMAGNDRLLIVDATGDIDPGKLQEFFSKYIEPDFDKWRKEEEEQALQKQVSIPRSLWERLYQVSARSKGKRERYAKRIQDDLQEAVLRWVEEEEKRLTNLGS